MFILKEDYLRALKLNEENIIEDLIVDDIIYDLRTCASFTQEHQELILHEVTSKAKVIKLLDIIREHDDELFEKFLDILRSTNEDLAEQLHSGIHPYGNTRTRRNSETLVGNIMVKGGVPDLTSSYIPRKEIEDKILNLLTSSHKKPILVHGLIGCGKSSLIIKVLRSERLFLDRFKDCCWLSIGNIFEKDVIKTLTILQKKLNVSKSDDLPITDIPEILVENIKNRLRDTTTLLILDDVWSFDIMKYFTFQCKYIVISRVSNIFPYETAELVQIPEEFEEEKCKKLLDDFEIDRKWFSVIIEKSHKNLMFLSMLAKNIKSNPDYFRIIININTQTLMKKIVQEYVLILDKETQKYYEMLVILQRDDILTMDMLSIYWKVDTNKALEIIGKLCYNNFLYKKWNPEHNYNMYGIHCIHFEYLQEVKKENQLKFQECQKHFIKQYEEKYKSWLDIDHTNPAFIKLHVTILADQKNFAKLRELYTDFKFLAAKIVICGIGDLMSDYETHNYFENDSNCIEFQKFLMKYIHKFIRLPSSTDIILKIGKVFVTLIQLGLYEMKESITYQLAHKTRCCSKRNDFWIWINPQKSIKTWEISDDGNITHVDVNQDAILLGNDRGQIFLLQYSNGKLIFKYQISDHDIILVKFTHGLEFMVIDSTGKSWKFDPMAPIPDVPNFNSLEINDENVENDDYNDDADFNSSPKQTSNNSIDFLSLKHKFQHILAKQFIERCKSFQRNVTMKTYSKAFLFPHKIVLLEINDNSTYVGIYDDSDGQLTDDFTVSCIIKKLDFQNDEYYALQESGKICKINEFGLILEPFEIENQVIIDFCIITSKIFCAVQNSIYIYPKLLFSIDSETHISRISMSPDGTLLAVSVTNDSVELWNYSSEPPELVYILNDSQFTNVYFSPKHDSLITIGQTNVAKWDIVTRDNNSKNNNNENENEVSLSDHREIFALQQLSPDTFVLMTQSFQKNLKFYEFQRETSNCEIIVEDLEASCYYTCGSIGFIGFTVGLIKIYDLNTLAKVGEINTGSEMTNMYAFHVSQGVLGLISCQKSPLGIMSYHLDGKNYGLSNHFELEWPQNVSSVIKFFKISERELFLAMRCSSNCVLYKLNENQLCKTQSYNLNHSIIDCDISDNNQYLCLVAITGQVKIWRFDRLEPLVDQTIEESKDLRKCMFRPMNNAQNYKAVAVINDEAVVFLIYFNETNTIINTIIEDSPAVARQLLRAMIWSSDSNYLLVGDYDIRKWKVPLNPRGKNQKVKLPLTKLQTFFGGIQSIQLTENVICTVDKQGFLYVLKRID